MPFDPNKSFKVVSQFNPDKPFKRLGFDSSRPFQVVDDLLKGLKIKSVKTISKPEISPPKPISKPFVEPPPKPLSLDDVSILIHAALQKIPQPKPVEKVIEKQTKEIVIKEIKEVEKKDKSLDELKLQVKELKEQIEKIKEFSLMMGGSGVIGLPNPEGNAGKTLQVVGGQWKPVTASSGGGSSPDVYTTSNVTTTRTLDPTTSTIDNIYNVLASLIVSLQGAGIIS